MTTILTGAEPMSAAGGRTGVLFVHGFTGSPSSLRAMALAAAAAGHTVELPRLPGHGTSEADLAATGWGDWTSAVEAAFADLAARVDEVVVVALSAGGAWTSWLAIEGHVMTAAMMVNPFVVPLSADLLQQVHEALAAGIDVAPGDGPDIAKPGVAEVTYDGTPLRPLLALNDGLETITGRLDLIDVPLLVATSPADAVVPPTNSDHLAAHASGPVRRISLDRSRHVATQDHDQPLLIDEMLDFIKEVTA